MESWEYIGLVIFTYPQLEWIPTFTNFHIRKKLVKLVLMNMLGTCLKQNLQLDLFQIVEGHHRDVMVHVLRHVLIMRREDALDVQAVAQIVVKTLVIIFVQRHVLIIAMEGVRHHVVEIVHI